MSFGVLHTHTHTHTHWAIEHKNDTSVQGRTNSPKIEEPAQNPRCQVKDKFHSQTGHEGPEVEYRYRSTLSLNLELDGVGGERHAPAALPPVKTR